MDLQDLLARLAVALGIGLLIGLERGWRTREEASGSRTAGIRTFAISGMLGGILGALAIASGGAASAGGGIIIGAGFAAYAAVMAMFTREENRADKTFSATTTVAAMTTFALGAYSLVGDMRAAAATAVAVAVVLALRESLHGWIANITWPELRSALVLLAMTAIALPIVPDAAIGPYGNVNPREIWVIAIVLAGISFAGYVAVKYLGTTHGTLLAGAAGGLVSSTAVTITNARHASAHPESSRVQAAGVALANGIMFLRVLVIAATLNAPLITWLAPTLLVAALTALAFALIAGYWRGRTEPETREVKLRNPFSFWSVVGFALLLAVVLVAGRALVRFSAPPGPSRVRPSRGCSMLTRSRFRWRGSHRSRSIAATRPSPSSPRPRRIRSARLRSARRLEGAASRSSSPRWHSDASSPAVARSG